MYSRHPDPRRVWKGGSEQHLLTPLPGAPRAPGANSKKLYVAVFYNVFGTIALLFFGTNLYVAVPCNDFCTIALPFFVENLYVHGFCGEFGYPHNIPYNMLSTFRKKVKIGSETNLVCTWRFQQFWKSAILADKNAQR